MSFMPYPEVVKVFPATAPFHAFEVVFQCAFTFWAVFWKYKSADVILHRIHYSGKFSDGRI